jgi:hypothetical protein
MTGKSICWTRNRTYVTLVCRVLGRPGERPFHKRHAHRVAVGRDTCIIDHKSWSGLLCGHMRLNVPIGQNQAVQSRLTSFDRRPCPRGYGHAADKRAN